MSNKFGCAAAPILGIATSAMGVMLSGRMWRTCDVGGSTANVGALLFFYGPGLFLATVAASGLAFALLQRWGTFVALTVAVALSILTLWAFLALARSLGDYPSPICDDNIPYR